MKKVVLSVMLVASMVVGCKNSQTQVPAAVKSSFNHLYPKVKNVEWELDEKGWEAEFSTPVGKTSAVFLSNGKLVEMEEDITAAALPAPVRDSLGKLFPNGRIEEVEKKLKDGKLFYKVKAGGRKFRLDSQGRQLPKRKEL